MIENLNPFYKQLKAKTPINITSQLKKNFDPIKKAPNVAS